MFLKFIYTYWKIITVKYHIEINPVEILIFHCYALVDDKDGIELENIDVSDYEKRLHPSNEIGVEGASETKAKTCSFFSSQFRRLKDTFLPPGNESDESSVIKEYR